MTRVIAFGAFDPLNEGHQDFLRQAKSLGDHLTVVVAHDSAIRAHKQREPQKPIDVRVAQVKNLDFVDDVIAGRKTSNKYHILDEINFDIIALGYNQKPSDHELRLELEKRGKHQVKIIRLKPHQAEDYPPN